MAPAEHSSALKNGRAPSSRRAILSFVGCSCWMLVESARRATGEAWSIGCVSLANPYLRRSRHDSARHAEPRRASA
jgi:hypothetical protein